MDLSYLLKSNYDDAFLRKVYTDAEVVSELEFTAFEDKRRVYRVEYRDHAQFVRIAKAFGIMDDFKVPVQQYSLLFFCFLFVC